MSVGIFVNTPAQVHFFRNISKQLEKRGHEVYILFRDYGETKNLIKELKLPAYLYSSSPDSKIGKILMLPVGVRRAAGYLRDNRVDLITGCGVYDAYTSFLLRKPAIIFTDSEPMANRLSFSIQFKLYLPFVNAVITPSSFREDLGEKHIRVNSFKELAYLHPNYFTPSDDIYDLLGIGKQEEFAILRFNAFDAVHDVGISGFSNEDKIRLVKELEKYVTVFISSEAGVPYEIKNRVMKIPKSRIHDALYYAKLLVADTGTMVTEAACLGTPAIRIRTHNVGVFAELDKKYRLISEVTDPNHAIQEAGQLIQEPNLKNDWRKKKERLLADKIDITQFMVWFVENYPQSFEAVKNDPQIQSKFRVFQG